MKTIYRPKTRGELLDKLKAGIPCEVLSSNVEFTNICLDGWLKFENQYATRPSENPCWTIYESVSKTN